jgi:putative transposase
MIDQAQQLATQVGVPRACEVLTVPRSSFYRPPGRPGGLASGSMKRPAPIRALNEAQRLEVRDTLNSERFQDQAPRQVWACLLDEGHYLCSWRTMYRILNAYVEVRERRNQLRRPLYTKPELMATAPNQVWTWDITKLRGPTKGLYFFLYVILDLFSR